MKFFSRGEAAKDPLAQNISLKTQIRIYWQDLHLLWKSMIVVGILAILAIPFYGRALRANKTRSYEQDLAAAREALAGGRDIEARDLSIALLRRDPKNNDPLPLLMHAAAGARDAMLTPIARHYLELDTQNKPDRVFAWQAITKDSPMGIAGITWLASIRDNEKADSDFLYPWLERLKTERLGHEIEGLLAKQSGVIDPRMERIRLSMLAIRATEDSYRELQARLFDRLASHPADGTLLVDSIDDVPQSELIPYSFIGFGEWMKTLDHEPSSENQLRLARCEMAAKPESAEAILSRMASTYSSSAPLPLAQLYLTLDLPDKAEELLKPLVAKGELAVFPLLAKVYERQGKLDEWDRLLEAPPQDAFLPGVLCDRAFIATQRGDERSKTKFEQEASIYAEKRLQSDSLIHLARHASDRGMEAYALGIWVKAIRIGPASPLPLFTSISPVFETLARDKQETQLLEVLTVYRVADPGNLDVITQHLYLSCLVGSVTPKQVLSVLAPLKEKFGTQALNLTIAFANLLEGHTDLANQLTSDNSIDWFSQIPAYRAIRAITLAKTGQKEEADIYLEDFPWDAMLPCEKRVFREMLELPKESTEAELANKREKLDKAKIAEGVRQAQKAKELMEIRKELEAKETTKSEEQKIAEKNQKAEKARVAEKARQARRIEELNEVRAKLAARAAKEAAEAAKSQPKDDLEKPATDEVEIIKKATQEKAAIDPPKHPE